MLANRVDLKELPPVHGSSGIGMMSGRPKRARKRPAEDDFVCELRPKKSRPSKKKSISPAKKKATSPMKTTQAMEAGPLYAVNGERAVECNEGTAEPVAAIVLEAGDTELTKYAVDTIMEGLLGQVSALCIAREEMNHYDWFDPLEVDMFDEEPADDPQENLLEDSLQVDTCQVLGPAEEALHNTLRECADVPTLVDAMKSYSELVGFLIPQGCHNNSRYIRYTCESHRQCPFIVRFEREGQNATLTKCELYHGEVRVSVSDERIKDTELEALTQLITRERRFDTLAKLRDHLDEYFLMRDVAVKKVKNNTEVLQIVCSLHSDCEFNVVARKNISGIGFTSNCNFEHSTILYQGKHRRNNRKFVGVIVKELASVNENVRPVVS